MLSLSHSIMANNEMCNVLIVLTTNENEENNKKNYEKRLNIDSNDLHEESNIREITIKTDTQSHLNNLFLFFFKYEVHLKAKVMITPFLYRAMSKMIINAQENQNKD